MQQIGNGKDYIFSATDLVQFLACNHSTVLDLRSFTEKLEEAETPAANVLLQKKGLEHEAAYLQKLKEQGKTVVEISKDIPLVERARQTKAALKNGADVVYQGVFYSHPWRGDADFLVKTETLSNLGNYGYEVVDTKLSRHPDAKHLIQLCVYADLLSDIQGNRPEKVHLVLGNGEKSTFNVDEYFYYYAHAKRRFEEFVARPSHDSYPEPCQYCAFCSWKDLCEKQWVQDDHLSLVANIRKSQIDKLKKAGITSVVKLAAAPEQQKVPDLNADVFKRLRSQAMLQRYKMDTGNSKHEMISPQEGRGFERLPHPDDGDLFFDMEGDPLHPNGLEYLFGIYYLDHGKYVFQPFWAHDHDEEKETFKEFMTFLGKRMVAYPNAHIYHYIFCWLDQYAAAQAKEAGRISKSASYLLRR